MQLWRPSRGGCSPQRSFSFFWMTSSWFQDPNEWEMLWHRRTTCCGLMRGFDYMVERSTSGIERGRSRAEALDPDTRDRVWRGSEVPTTKQGIKVLGTPLGHEDFVREHLERTREKHRILLRRIPIVPQCPVCLASAPSIVRRREPIVCCVWSGLSGPWILPRLTVKKCGNVCAAFWRCLLERSQSHECPPRFQWHWEVLG